MKKVYGSYESPRQAREAVDNLLRENYTKDQIRVISSPNFMTDNDQRDNYTQSKERLVERDIRYVPAALEGVFDYS